MPASRLIAAVACGLVLLACTGEPDPEPTPAPSGRSPAPRVAVATDPDCPDTGLCASGVRIEDDFYTDYGCEPVAARLLGRLFAVGEPGLRWDRFRTIEGAHTEILLAARAVEPPCTEGGWFVVQLVGPQRTREEAFGLHHDWCLLGNAQLCTDRVLEWEISPAREHKAFGYIPERIERVNAAIDAGDPEYVWRLDPYEVLRREPYWQRCGRDPGIRCRAGGRVTARAPNRVEILVLHQNGSREFRQYTSTETRFVLERLGGGSAWWLTERREVRDTLHPGRGESARAASDALWEGCCSEVLFDVHAA